MNTPYEFGYEIGRLVKRADFSDDALEDEKAEVRNQVGWNAPGRSRTPFGRPEPVGPAQAKPAVKPPVKPALKPAPMRPAPMRPAPHWLRSGPTSSPDFKGAVE